MKANTKRAQPAIWSVFCPDGQIWESELGEAAARLEEAMADRTCPCGGQHNAIAEGITCLAVLPLSTEDNGEIKRCGKRMPCPEHR